LATGILALPFDTLDRLVQDEDAWEEKVGQFRHFRDLWRQQGILPMLRLMLQIFLVPSRLLSQPGGERILTNLLHLSELLQTASAALQGEQALIRWLAEQMEAPDTNADEQILRLESDEALIRVITIHKSKGLEYPVVFLPFICAYRKVSKRFNPVVTIHDSDGRRRLVIEPDENELAIADKERLAEDLRLLYVAMTRAKYACCMGTAVLGRDNAPEHSALGYLLAAGNPIAPTALADKLIELKGDCPHIDIQPLPQPRPTVYASAVPEPLLTAARTFSEKIPDDWWIASYSRLVKGAHADKSEMTVAADEDIDTWPSADLEISSGAMLPHSAREDHLLEVITESIESTGSLPAGESARSIHGFFRGPEPGSFLHDILEWAATEGFSDLASRRKDMFGKISDLCRRRNWQEWEDVLTDWLENLLRTPIRLSEDLGDMALAELSRSDCLPEMEFWFTGHGVSAPYLDAAVSEHILPKAARSRLQYNTVNGMLTGFIDLVFCHENRYYVIDYKSNHLGDDANAYTFGAMAEAMLAHRYDIQYVLYTLALHRHLKMRLPDYDYEKHIGGAVYLFLRGVDDQGHGIFLDRPPQRLIESLDRAFAGKEARHAD
jgi:exodeoxyribonuclease V beta subunit